MDLNIIDEFLANNSHYGKCNYSFYIICIILIFVLILLWSLKTLRNRKKMV